MKIAIVPTVREIHKNQFDISIDKRIFDLFNKVYDKKCSFKILNGKNTLSNEKLMVILGGNSILKISRKKKDLIRSRLDSKYFLQAKNKKIKIIGICHGAQFIADKFGSKLKKSQNHVKKNHQIEIGKKKYLVNSYHDYIISNYGKNIIPIGVCEDKSLELFKIYNHNIFGIMWHPERYQSFKRFDLKNLKEICN